jgi:hypothetical protein
MKGIQKERSQEESKQASEVSPKERGVMFHSCSSGLNMSVYRQTYKSEVPITFTGLIMDLYKGFITAKWQYCVEGRAGHIVL